MVDSVSIRPAKPPMLRDSQLASKAPIPLKDLAAHAPQKASLPKLVQMAAALAQQGTPVDFAKIAQVRHAIATGDYTIEPERIADAMIRFHARKDS